jgi:hypothetical protein
MKKNIQNICANKIIALSLFRKIKARTIINNLKIQRK